MNRPRGLGSLAMTTAVLLTGGIVAAGPAAAAPSRSIVPLVNCRWDNKDGTYTVSLGYDSRNATTQVVGTGGSNKFQPGGVNQGQPTTFYPGVHNNVFVVTIDSWDIRHDLTWQVTGNSVDVTNPVTACSTKPVSLVGSAKALGVAVLAALVAGLAGLATLNRRRKVSP